MYWGRKPGTLINGLRGSLDMGFPSVPGLFTETKLCSLPSPTQQPQQIPVTSSRHALKNNHPPATETSVLPTFINTHITSATYIHILLCLCPISMLGSEILNLLLFFTIISVSSSSFSWLNETPESKTKHLPMLQTSSKMKQLMTAVKFSSHSHSPNQQKLIRAGPQQPKCHKPKLHGLRKFWDFTTTWHFCKQPSTQTRGTTPSPWRNAS